VVEVEDVLSALCVVSSRDKGGLGDGYFGLGGWKSRCMSLPERTTQIASLLLNASRAAFNPFRSLFIAWS
jgi:hypothetical protein